MLDPASLPPEGETPDGDARAVEDVITHLLRDQCRRWQRGERMLAEAYREQYPHLAQDPIGMVDLIYNEILQRQQRGETPQLEEYTRRFPEHAEEIHRQFSVHRAFIAPTPGGAGQGWPGQPADRDATTGPVRPPGSPPDAPDAREKWPEIPGYEILAELGKGGMGVVYRARHLALDRVVALKMLRAGDLSDPAEVRRFTAEARAMAKLDHPNVVPIYEVGEHRGQPYFTMKLLGGGSLDRHLGRFRADPHRSVGLAEKVARAVHYLHEHQILHRDLKPFNILLDERDEPHVSDFGLAKFLEGGLDLTVQGTVMGTLPYMAPEQARGQTHLFSPRTEVWTLGVILYELLTGQRPFAAGDRAELTRLILAADFPPPRSVRPGIDPALEGILLRCLQSTPVARYPSARALADDLGRWLRGKSTHGLSAHPLRRCWQRVRRHPILGATAAFCIVTGMALALPYLLEGPRETDPALLVRPPVTPARTLMGERGRPLTKAQWVIHEKEAVEGLSPRDGTFFLRSSTFSLLELGDAPPWPRYRLAAEVRHDDTGEGGAGFYFARRTYQSDQGVKHLHGTLAFTDRSHRGGGGKAWLEFNCFRTQERGFDRSSLGDHFFPSPPVQEPKPWRKLVAEVSPEGVHVTWEGAPVATLPGTRLQQRAAGVVQLGVALPWEVISQGGFGLYINKGAASFRRVTIQPLPQGK